MTSEVFVPMKGKKVAVRLNKIRADGEYEFYRGKLIEIGDGFIKLDLRNGKTESKIKSAILATDSVMSVWEYN